MIKPFTKIKYTSKNIKCLYFPFDEEVYYNKYNDQHVVHGKSLIMMGN